MQHNWQHIIYNREETPPPGAWDNIAHKLEMADAGEDWSTEIYLKETTPPQGAWDTIAHKLEMADTGENWSTVIYLAEATPPAGAWNDIAAALDTASKSDWQTKLYEKEVAPPAGVWAAINTALDATDTRVITMQPRRKLYYRLAAAAAVIVAIAGTALWFAGKPSSDNASQTFAKNTVTEKQVTPAKKETTETAALPATETQEKQQPAAVVVKKQTKPTGTQTDDKIIPPLEYVKNNQMGFLPENPVLNNNKKLPGNNGQVNTDIALMDAPANTYISISGPDGQSIRVSSKFTNLIGYLSDGPVKEERLDIIIRESALWKATFRQWKEKMISNTSAPSLDNFMDIIEMSKMLNEK
jgi:hypothetical protein